MKNDLRITRLFLTGVFISSLILSPFSLDFTLIPRFISLAVFLSVCLYLAFRNESVPEFKPDVIIVTYTAYILFCSFSLFWSQNKSESFLEIFKLHLAFLVFLFTFLLLKKQENYFMEKLIQLAVIIFFIVFFVGCYQFSGLNVLTVDSLYNLTGLNGHKNLYASFLFLNLYFLFRGATRFTGIWKIVSRIAILLNITALIVLKTKAVWLGMAVAIFMYVAFYIYQKKGRILKLNFFVPVTVLLIGANIIFLFCLPPVIDKGINRAIQKTAAAGSKKNLLTVEQERLVLWSKTYQVIHKHPIAGVGMGNWQVYFPDATLTGLYRAEDLNYTFQRPHNDFLWLLCETGIIGLDLFLLLVISLLVLLARALNYTKDNKQARTDLLLSIAFITGYFTISFFDFPKERIEHILWSGILLGIAYYQVKQHVTIPSLKGFVINRSMYRLSFVLLFLIVISGLLRYKGEYFTRRLYYYKNNNHPAEIVIAGKAAWSSFYTLDPTSVPVNWYIANAYASMGDYPDAQDYFLRAYKDNPYNRNVLNDLASAYVFSKNNELAKKYYEEASRISPRFDDPKLNLAAVYIKEKNFVMAAACVDSMFHDSERRTHYKKIIELEIEMSKGR